MKTLFTILFFSFFTNIYFTEIEENKDIVVTPGVGFKEIKIRDLLPKGKFKFREIIFENRENECTVPQKHDDCCCSPSHKIKYHSFWKIIYNQNLGLTFEFNSIKERDNVHSFDERMFLTNITLSNKGCTSNNFCIGESTYNDVIKKYNITQTKQTSTNHLKFEKEGVSFRFNKKSILIEIKVFEKKID